MKSTQRSAALLLIPLMLLVLSGAGVRGQQVSEQEPGLYSTGEIKALAKVTPQKKILIRSASSLSGLLVIETAQGEAVSLFYQKQARTANRKKGIDYIDLISVTLASVADEIRIEMRAPNPAPWEANAEAGLVQARLTVPPSCVINIEAVAFDVTAKGPFQGIVIPSSMGRLEISKVTGTLDIATANQRVLLDDITGDISAATTNANLTARSISCPRNPGKFRNESGDIKIEKADGGLNIRNRYGRTEISGFKPTGSGSFIRNTSGPIVADLAGMTDGRLVITNEYEDIELRLPDSLSASLSLSVDDDGSIDASQFRFVADLVEHNRLNLRLGQGTGNISASIRGKGNILVRGESGD